jgi:AcrR family transcriptional regulator
MKREETALRWGDGRRAAPDFAREQILDAALRCYQQFTYQEASMGQIAREAKVSRTTIYRHFENREEVVLGVITRELYKVIGVLGERVTSDASFGEFIVETLVLADEQVRSSPVFELLLRETSVLLSRVPSYTDEIVALTGAYFLDRFEAARAAGELRDGVEFSEFMDWLCHIGASYIIMSFGDSGGFRAMLWRYLMPAVMREEAIPADKRV